ncbi:hypothetical protein HUT03_02990 [Candidatus Liberibacter africanus]|uniref:GcrA cell cycle regulator n=1 Tax=Candidatus Liberibacter africanus PTSAPSY TaxID=1277257 RepID=A0A0G3I2V7_LIBAF|nr:GcrA family cell cycle regulator [Candidatus Liberibacter africanus]AKK20224.1 hypothetical protein G293_02980 [Candidatus Liberibacter africanus PTSAPSY]QTP64001.1 hypothetical protein HUT03_02990 [Candidatus Liberibacter africanus]
MVWTDERIDKLKKFWSEGLSASQIAVQLGGVTRNAVIGKLHRLLLPSRVKVNENKQSGNDRKNRALEYNSSKMRQDSDVGVSAPVLKERIPNSAPKRKAKPVSEKDNAITSGVVLPMSRCLRLMELTENTCKWPLGDPFGKDFSFCGSDVHNDSPYCDYHKKLAYQQVHDRRKIQANSQ